jgi:hypothetical protein
MEKFMLKRSLIALALAAALPLSAQAGEINYTYLQGGYSAADLDGGTFGGWGIKGSAAFSDMFYGSATYNTGSNNGDNLDQWNVTVGAHTSGDIQWYGEASYIHDSAQVSGIAFLANSSAQLVPVPFDVTNSQGGFGVAGGLRTMLGDNFEVGANINYVNVGTVRYTVVNPVNPSATVSYSTNFGNGFGVGVSGLFHITDMWGIYAGYEFNDRSGANVDAYGIGVRASF